jgi:hypothetical protein
MHERCVRMAAHDPKSPQHKQRIRASILRHNRRVQRALALLADLERNGVVILEGGSPCAR